VVHPYKQLTLTDCPKCKCQNFKTVYFCLKQFVFRFLFCDTHTFLRYHSWSTFSLEKKLIFMLFYYFVNPRRLKKFMLMHWKSLFCFIKQFLVEKVVNSNILLQNRNCFREQVSHVQIFTTSKNLSFDQQKLLPWLFAFSWKRDMDRDKKLNSILRQH